MEMSTTVATAERFTEFSYKQLPGFPSVVVSLTRFGCGFNFFFAGLFPSCFYGFLFLFFTLKCGSFGDDAILQTIG